MNAEFALHPQLAADCFSLADGPLSRLLLMDDAQYPWFILVPRVGGIREIYELSREAQALLLSESVDLGAALMRAYGGDKLNVAALGNAVPQLHVHHIVRRRTDAAWPAPVWGRHPPQPYTQAARAGCIARLRPLLGALWRFG